MSNNVTRKPAVLCDSDCTIGDFGTNCLERGESIPVSKTYDFLKECGTFFVISLDGNMPQGRPFGVVLEYNDTLYFTTGTMKKVYKQIKSNGNIQIIALKSGTRDWIRIDGVAAECSDYEMKVRILNDCPLLKSRFPTPDCAYFAVFKMEIRHSELHKENEVEVLR